MKWVSVALGVLALVAVVTIAAVGIGGVMWDRASDALTGALLAGSVPPAGTGVPTSRSEGETGGEPGEPGVPASVVRFFARSLPDGGAPVGVARLRQEGMFQMGEGAEGWRPFTAEQVVRADPPGFVWDARIRMAPLLSVRVRDAYLDGRGAMTAKIGGLVTVMDAPPTPELATAALLRYLAEAAWMPSVLLPSERLGWEEVDATRARVTLTDAGLTATALVTFDDEGDIVSVYVPDRGREVDGAYVPTPWMGRFWDHDVVDGGFRIPREGEVAWIVEGDTIPYWRGRVTSVEYSGRP